MINVIPNPLIPSLTALFHVIHLIHRKFMFLSVFVVSRNVNKKLCCVIILFSKIFPKKNFNWSRFPFQFSIYEFSFLFYRFLRWLLCDFLDKTHDLPIWNALNLYRFEHKIRISSRYILVSTTQFYFETLYVHSDVLIHIYTLMEKRS